MLWEYIWAGDSSSHLNFLILRTPVEIELLAILDAQLKPSHCSVLQTKESQLAMCPPDHGLKTRCSIFVSERSKIAVIDPFSQSVV